MPYGPCQPEVRAVSRAAGHELLQRPRTAISVHSVTTTCYACDRARHLDDGPLSEAIHVKGGWRVAHALNTSLPGWLVLMPLRHVTAVDQLTPEEASAMGLLIRKCGAVSRVLFGAEKSYFMFFAEAEGFAHLHIHVVPRMDWFDEAERGPGIFSLIGLDEAQSLDAAARDAVAEQMRALLHAPEV